MGQNNGSYILKKKLVLLGALCLFFILYQKAVFGFSYDTAVKNDCAGCHSLRKSKAKPGTWAVKKDVIRDLDSSESQKPDRWACDPCHQFQNKHKTFDFAISDTTLMPPEYGGNSYIANSQYPSSHPVPMLGKNFSQIRTEYGTVDAQNNPVGRIRPIMYCTHCHDPLQIGRGIHKTYVSAFRLRFSGVDSAGVRHFDPDPTDDTVSIGVDSSSWFWTRPFDSTDSSFKGFLKVGFIPHKSNLPFDPKNSKEDNKELTDFDTLQLASIYFCVTCHDSNGFPQDPMDTTVDVLDTSNKRIHPQNFANGLYGYDASDGDDSVYTPADGGHTIQGLGVTNNGLKTGDKIACITCHEVHNSKNSRRLLKESLSAVNSYGAIVAKEGIPKEFCVINCHNGSPSNVYYTNGLFTKAYGTTQMLPAQDSRGRDIRDAHSGPSRKTCYSFVPQDAQKYYSQGGCHKDPHRPTMFCNACHQDHYDVNKSVNTGHPVGVMLTSTPLPGDTISIRDYYMQYGDTLEVPIFGGTNSYYNGYIDCFTCHNDHSADSETAYAPQMQGLLRGDAGPNIIANLDSVKLGVGNNYPNHDSSYNTRLQNLATSGGGMSVPDFQKLEAMPELCVNCHYRVVGVRFNHGGFTGAGFGRCDKCHSMHGQHPEPVAADSTVDSSCLIRPLRFGMYLDTGKVNTFTELNSDTTLLFVTASAAGRAYKRVKTELDSTGHYSYYTTYVWKDYNGKWFSSKKNDLLLHEALQRDLCSKCHGNKDWNTIVDTTSGQKSPPQVLFDSIGTPRADPLDMYYTSYAFSDSTRNKSTHPVDLPDTRPPGYSLVGTIIPLKCSSGTEGSGCHNPHGNANFAQLNPMVMGSSGSTYGLAVVPYTTAGATFITRAYVSGMNSFCSLCHDLFGCGIYDSNSYDPAKGRYNYTRHPVGDSVSVSVLYDSADRGLMNSTFFSSLILDYNTTDYSTRPTYNDFLAADAAKASRNFIVACITCHRQHGSPNLHLRKFSDKGVVECVGCHGKSPDILK